MAQGKLPEANKLLPRAFREVYGYPKIREQIKAIGTAPVKAMIEFQLARLASLMTTGGNLNDDMTDFISAQLIELYPTESIADIRLCFERGAIGRYGQIQRMDGLVVGDWMTQYLEEKYTDLETLIEKRKATDITKEPVEDLKPVYAKMADDTTKKYMVKQFEKEEMARKYGVTKCYVCDGHDFFGADEVAARKNFRIAFGKDPEVVSLKNP